MTAYLPHTALHWMLVGAAAATVLFFVGGLTVYFERAPRPRWVLAVHYGSMVCTVLQFLTVLLLDTRADGFVVLGIVMYSAAMVVFLSAIEAAKRTRLQRSFMEQPLPDRLITDGPFKWVRHPFCSGYLLAALAGPVAIEHWLAVVAAVPLMVVAIAAAVREERAWLSTPARAEEYRAYRKRTGMFIPSIGRDLP
jgi:protein-S-isoprenylcysteine O-methyltransferase Ste14